MAKQLTATVIIMAGTMFASLSANVALTAALVKERTAPIETYSLVSQSADGNQYVHDTGMSLTDCRNRPDMGHPVQWCEIEAPRGMLIGFDCEGALGPIYATSESDMPVCAHIVRSR